MGSVDGGLSNQFTITALNQQIKIPFPTIDSSLIDSVILMNCSPYLIQVDMGVSNKGWLGPFMVDKFVSGSTSSVNCTPVAIAGQNPNYPIPVALLTAAFVMKTELADNVGTYPIALLSSQAVVIASVLELLYNDGHPSIIAQGNQINFFDDAGNNVMRLDPVNGIQIAGGSNILPAFPGGTGISIAPAQSVIVFQPYGLASGVFGPQLQASSTASGGRSNLVVTSGQSTGTSTEATIQFTSDYLGGNDPFLIAFPPLSTTDPSYPRGSGPVETWHNATLLNGWTGLGAAGYYNGLRYYLDAAGQAHLDGTLRAPASGSVGPAIINVPAGYRPSTTKIFTLLYTANAPQLGDFLIKSTGDFVMSSELGSGNGGALFVTAQWPTL